MTPVPKLKSPAYSLKPASMNYRLVLWDFDGTLADSLKLALEIYNRIAPKYKALPTYDPDSLRGLPAREIMKRHNVRCHRFPFLIREFLIEQRRRISEVGLHEGIAETLESITKAGLRQAIVSSNSEQNIRACLEQHGVLEHFEFVIGMRRLFGKKRGIKKALKLAGLTAGEVLYVGDETRDIRAAHQMRVPIASVTWGINTKELLEESHPEHLITQPDQLLPILQNAHNA